jgi:GNAT superfamily N-acetyltransferase
MFEIRELQAKDILQIVKGFDLMKWNKPPAQFEKYLAEQHEDSRKILVAFENNDFAGYLTILWNSHYPPFNEQSIPEINDFNVLLKVRRKGIGSRLMDEAERTISERSEIAGISVGLDSDYGAAQRLYVLRGYVPDGRGIVWQNRFPKYGEQVLVDNHLNLYLTKKLR